MDLDIRNWNMGVRNHKYTGRVELGFMSPEVYVVEGERQHGGPCLVYHVNAWRPVGQDSALGKVGSLRRGCDVIGVVESNFNSCHTGTLMF